MKMYILFIFGNFEDHGDIEFFCLNVLAESPVVSSLKYVIDYSKNVIVIFESKESKDVLVKELESILDNENVIFYFMFEKEDLLASYIPEKMISLIFKPTSIDDVLEIKVKREPVEKKTINLDDILDKIDKNGIDSLTAEEKNFLDNFEK